MPAATAAASEAVAQRPIDLAARAHIRGRLSPSKMHPPPGERSMTRDADRESSCDSVVSQVLSTAHTYTATGLPPEQHPRARRRERSLRGGHITPKTNRNPPHPGGERRHSSKSLRTRAGRGHKARGGLTRSLRWRGPVRVNKQTNKHVLAAVTLVFWPLRHESTALSCEPLSVDRCPFGSLCCLVLTCVR